MNHEHLSQGHHFDVARFFDVSPACRSQKRHAQSFQTQMDGDVVFFE